MEIDVEIPAQFSELVEPTKEWRHICFHGGRSSGKSTTVAEVLAIKATSEKLRILCAREYQASIADSVHKLIADIIAKYNLPGWEITREAIKNSNGWSYVFLFISYDITNILRIYSITIIIFPHSNNTSNKFF